MMPTVVPSSEPTAVPSSAPSVSELTIFNKYMDSRIGNLSSLSTIWYQEKSFAGEQIFGGCDSWLQLSQSKIEERSFFGIPQELYLEKASWPEKSLSSISCSNVTETGAIVDAFRARSTGSYDCNNHTWKIEQCYDHSLSVCVDCLDPCDPLTSSCGVLSFSPCISLPTDANCGESSDFGLLISIKYRVRSPPPTVLGINVTNTSSSSVSIDVVADSRGFVSCLAVPFYRNVDHDSISSEVFEQGVSSVLRIENNMTLASLKISGLLSLHKYRLLCGTESTELSKSSTTDIIATEIVVNTSCCKQLSVSLLESSTIFTEGNIILDLVRLSVNIDPVNRLDVAVSVMYSSLDSSAPLNLSEFLFPDSNISFSPESDDVVLSLNYATLPGSYSLSVLLSGPSELEYVSAFIGDSEFLVFASDEEPPVPTALNSVFSYDGTLVFVNFDSPTDMNNAPFGPFPCESVALVNDLESLTCQWVNNKNLSISVAGIAEIVDGSEVRILGDVLRAACTLASCVGWATIPLTILDAAVPEFSMLPTVSAVSAPFLGKCDNLNIDLSASRGSLGRAWRSVVISVSSTLDSDYQVSVIENYLNDPSNQTKTNIVFVPRSYLKSGSVYTVEVQLCNFLLGCASRKLNVAVTADTAPTAIIEGAESRTIHRSDDLYLYASAYTITCEGSEESRTSANIEYTWEVFSANGLILNELSSESNSVSNFKLSKFSLDVNTFYTFKLSVYDKEIKKLSSASAVVFVQQGDIVALLDASSKALPMGSTIEIDASQSYDTDVLSTDLELFAFTWKCSQLQPSLSSICPIVMRPNSSKVVLSATSGSDFTKSVISLVLEDRSADPASGTKRKSIASATIDVVESTAPVVNFKTVAREKHNTDKKVKLLGRVDTITSCLASWSFSETGFDSDPNSEIFDSILTPSSEYLTVSSNFTRKFNVNLVLMPNALQPGKLYDFVLTCTPSAESGVAASSNTLTISMNDAPSPGTLIVTPVSGTELSTIFSMEASFWNDEDLPIRYDFGFVTLSGEISSLSTPPSENTRKTTVLSKLTGDSDDDEELEISLRVYDKYYAESFLATSVLLSSSDNAIESMTNLLQSDDVDEGSINLLSENLNAKDCSATPNSFCAEKHREKCFSHSNMCGACLEGYFGDDKGNSVCLTQSELDNVNSRLVYSDAIKSTALSCVTTSCAAWHHCVEVNGKASCVRDSKECPGSGGECSGHGTCVFLSSSLQPVSNCYLGSFGCTATCDCDDGYAGNDCSYLSEKFEEKKTLRYESIMKFKTLMSLQDNSLVQIESNINQIVSLSREAEELTEQSVLLIYDMVQSVIQSVEEVSTPNELLSKLFHPASIVADVLLSSGHLTYESSVELADELSYFIASDMTVGESDLEVISSFYRAKFSAEKPFTEVNKTYQSFLSALTTTEEILGLLPSRIDLTSTDIVIVDDGIVSWVLTYPSTAVDTVKQWNSNVLRISFLLEANSAVDTNEDSSTFSIILPNLNAQSYANSSDAQSWEYTVATACTAGTVEDIVVHCPDSGYRGDVQCDGLVSSVTSMSCPPIAVDIFPVCGRVEGSNENCEVITFDEFSTSCECPMSYARGSAIALSTSRRLSTLATTLTFEFSSYTVTNTSYDVSSVVTDVRITENIDKVFDNRYQAGQITVILMAAVVGAVILLTVSSYRLDYKKEVAVEERRGIVSPAEVPVVVADGVGNPHAAALVVDNSLPALFRGNSGDYSTLQRVNTEFVRSYKWSQLLRPLCGLLSPSAALSSDMVYDTAHCACDVLTALVITTVVYLWLEPSTIEDGSSSCFEQYPASECRSSRGRLFFGNRCSWSESDDECSYKGIGDLKYSMAMGAFVSALLTLFVSNIFHSVIKAYIFVPTLKIEPGDEEYHWLSILVPTFVASWFSRKRAECVPGSFWEQLYDVPVGYRYDHIYDNALDDLAILERKLVEHRRTLPTEEKKMKFSAQWNLDIEYDSWAVGDEENEDIWSDIFDSELPLGYKLRSTWKHFQNKIHSLKLSSPEEIFFKDLERVYTYVYQEQDTILRNLQVSNEPLNEARVMKLLFEDLLSDDECVIFNAKCESDGR